MPDLQQLLDLSPDAIRCPYPIYDSLRDAGGVTYVESADIFVVSRYDDVVAVARQPQLFSNASVMGPGAAQAAQAMETVLQDAPDLGRRVAGLAGAMGNVLFTADPPQHTRHRRLLNRAFTPRAVAGLEPSIRGLCDGLVDTFADRGRVELVSEFASPMPVLSIASLLGVPQDRRDDFLRWARALMAAIGTSMSPAEIRTCIQDQLEFMEYFRHELEERLASPRADMLTAVAKAHVEGEEPLTMDEMLGMCSQLLAAGADTTNKWITNAFVFLSERPDIQSMLRADPAMIPEFLEEVLRLEAPVQGLFRVATEDTEVGGVAIPKGAMLWILWASGNRDERMFDEPQEFEFPRAKARSHLSFGHGVHTCIGAPLARLEARVALEVLLGRLQDIQRASDEPLHYHPSNMERGIHSLELSFRTVLSRSGLWGPGS
jgi:cytochrome P450